MSWRVKFQDLKDSDLYRNYYYLTDRRNEFENSDDPISEMFNCGRTGVFRYVGEPNLKSVDFVILCYIKEEPDFPEGLDESLALAFIKKCFQNANTTQRKSVPPIFVFTTGLSGPRGLDALFRGLVIPGDQGLPRDRENHLIWSSDKVKGYLGHKVVFTVLDVDEISRDWINDLMNRNPLSKNCPEIWRKWIKTGECIPHTEAKAKKYLRYITGSTGFGDHIGRD
jgi:hypothetical protein